MGRGIKEKILIVETNINTFIGKPILIHWIE